MVPGWSGKDMTPVAPTLNVIHPYRIRPFRPIQCRSSRKGQDRRHRFLTQANLGRSEGPEQSKVLVVSLQKIGKWILGAGFAAAISFTILTQSVLAVTNEQLLFLEAWRAVDRAYYDKNFNGKPWFRIREQYIKDKALGTRQETYAAIRALLAELDDPFTRFLEPSRYAALKRGTAGSLTGVGLEVGFDMGAGSDSELVVITPSADGPADKAGIKPRDHVTAIDGKPTAGTSLYDAGELLQGTEGSQVTLTIQPQDGSETREVQLQRQRIINNPVSSQLCQKVPLGEVTDQPENLGKVGYIRVATFSKQTTDNVKTALHKLQAEHANMIVLDIRNNGGGLFPAGVEVARTLMNDGDIVLIADSQGVRDAYPASNVAVEPTKPLAVLVNRGTASASEVLAGALQDNGRAKVVGEKTFGKGLIQTIVELSDGSGVAVTVARYQTPLGTDINKKGIQPDISIDNGDMPPTSGPGFCKYVASRGAAVLFDANAAAKMPTGGYERAAGESMPIDVTQYENAFTSGQPSDATANEKKETTPHQKESDAQPSEAASAEIKNDSRESEAKREPAEERSLEEKLVQSSSGPSESSSGSKDKLSQESADNPSSELRQNTSSKESRQPPSTGKSLEASKSKSSQPDSMSQSPAKPSIEEKLPSPSPSSDLTKEASPPKERPQDLNLPSAKGLQDKTDARKNNENSKQTNDSSQAGESEQEDDKPTQKDEPPVADTPAEVKKVKKSQETVPSQNLKEDPRKGDHMQPSPVAKDSPKTQSEPVEPVSAENSSIQDDLLVQPRNEIPQSFGGIQTPLPLTQEYGSFFGGPDVGEEYELEFEPELEDFIVEYESGAVNTA